MKFRIAFIIVHILLILGAVVFFTYWEYPEARGAGAGRFRRITLSEIHKEMKSYKKETGNYPEMLESILHYDE